jgi:hypothetical protein
MCNMIYQGIRFGVIVGTLVSPVGQVFVALGAAISITDKIRNCAPEQGFAHMHNVRGG